MFGGGHTGRQERNRSQERDVSSAEAVGRMDPQLSRLFKRV